jgi:hypothetical protein
VQINCSDDYGNTFSTGTTVVVDDGADKDWLAIGEIAEGLSKLPPLTTRYTRIALTQKLRRIVDEGVGYGLALEGSALPMSRGRNE